MIKKRGMQSSGLRQIITEGVEEPQSKKTLREKVELAREAEEKKKEQNK